MPRGKPFEKGNTGRPKGAKDKIKRTVRETFLDVFLQLQEDPQHNLTAFAKENPKEFYALSSKLIPTEITGTTTQVFRVLSEENEPKENLSLKDE